ncbi:MAG: PAS domain S-box protein [bacterium]|nr:PAS domain S-box protein [bacterium]
MGFSNKKILLPVLFCLALVFGASSLHAEPIDLTRQDLFVKKGFSPDWISTLPEDNSWLRIPGVTTGKRAVRIKELGLSASSRRFLSLADFPDETYTFVTSFVLEEGRKDRNGILGLFLRKIGINWEIYCNGHLVKSELHLSPEGKIESSRNIRNYVISLDSRFLVNGVNVLAFKIVGNPQHIDTGFFATGQYVIDEYEILLEKRSNKLFSVLIFLYLFVGIYHLFLYMNRRKERYNLYYGLFTIAGFIYFFTLSSHISFFIQDTSLINRVEFSFLYILLPLLGCFIDQVVLYRISRFTVANSIYSIFLVAFTLPSPHPFLTDILRIWQFTAIIPLLYIFFTIFYAFVKDLIEFNTASGDTNKHGTFIYSFFRILRHTVAGNILIGYTVLLFSVTWDIIDSIYYIFDTRISAYTFLVFIMAIAFILSNRFIYVHKKIEHLNRDLKDKIQDLNEANTRITHSEEKYRFLVEGSKDIVFSLDENWNFITANKAISNQLNLRPESVSGLNFNDILYEDKDGVTKEIVKEKLEAFVKERAPIQFKARFKSSISAEPKEMQVRLEYINIIGKNEVLGKASSVLEDVLMRYFISEEQQFIIGNYLVTAEDITHRLTRNLRKYLRSKEVNLLRLGLREMVINAIEHGNLDISYNEKTELILRGEYLDFISERQNDPRYSERRVTIEYSIATDRVTYIISDEGKGFDYNKILNSELSDLNKAMFSHGRGILMARDIFDEIVYNVDGNRVVLVKRFGG